jgi:hypothetical protein
MTCPTCGQQERQDCKTVVDWRRRGDPPIMLHRQCPNGHAWHAPLVIKPGTEPALCDWEAVA